MSLQIKTAKIGAGGSYMGDPGLLGFLGGAVKKVAGAVGGLGVPIVSGVARGVERLIPGGGAPGKRTTPGMPQTLPVQSVPMGTNGFSVRGPGFAAGPRGIQISGPAVSIPGFGQRAPAAPTFQAPAASNGKLAGYRLNKSGYWLKTGQYVPPGTKWVKVRRRNSANMRALDRALGRVQGAKRLTRKLARVTIRKNCPA